MCYECACGDTMTTMSGDSITEITFKRAAKGANITLEQAKKNTLELLKRELHEK
jgi:hypothetical protein